MCVCVRVCVCVCVCVRVSHADIPDAGVVVEVGVKFGHLFQIPNIPDIQTVIHIHHRQLQTTTTTTIIIIIIIIESYMKYSLSTLLLLITMAIASG